MGRNLVGVIGTAIVAILSPHESGPVTCGLGNR
jgi:hypothetical protein